jgi:hypothetical protein
MAKLVPKVLEKNNLRSKFSMSYGRLSFYLLLINTALIIYLIRELTII